MLVQFVLPFNLVCHHLMSFLLSIIQYHRFSYAFFSTISLIYFMKNIRFNFLSNFLYIFLLTFFPYKVLFFFIITLYPYFLKLLFLQSSSNLFHLLILFVITLCHFFHRLLDIIILAVPSQPSFYFCFLNNIRFDHSSCSFSILTLICFLINSTFFP